MAKLGGALQLHDRFSERLQDVVKISGDAHRHFQLSNVEGKRRLVNLAFSTVKLRGKKLELTMRSPFDQFLNTHEIDQWRSRRDSNPRYGFSTV